MFVVRDYVCCPESCLYSGIMSRKSGCSYSGLMIVILDYARIQDSGNLEWLLVILDYARSTGFRSYYRIPGTWNGGFNRLI